MSTDRDVARSGHCAVVKDERDEARRTLTRGAIMLVTLPAMVVVVVALSVSGALHSYGPALIGLVYAVVAGVVGIVMTSLGAIQAHLAATKLAELDRDRLPEARLLR